LSVFGDVKEFAKVGDFKTLTEEGVADLLDAVTLSSHLLEDNKVAGLELAVLLEVGEMRQSLASSSTEEHLFHSVLFDSLNGTGNERDAALEQR